MQHTLASLGGVLSIVDSVNRNISNYPTQVSTRGLLFLFFGITFQENHQLTTDADNLNAYNNIRNGWINAWNLFANPGSNVYNRLPRYRCLEDYASYYTHSNGRDGQQNMSAELIGQMFDQNTPGGFKRPAPYNDVWPGLMFVNNGFDGASMWYPPDAADPPAGLCSACVAFTNTGFPKSRFTDTIAKALYGITACPHLFTRPLLLDLGTPIANGGVPEVRKFLNSSDLGGVHEIIHLVTDGVVIDQPFLEPPSNQWLTNSDWATWTFSAVGSAYGYIATAFLGLARPKNARLNADNWANFAGCMYFYELDCLGYFQNDIRTKRSVPLGLSPRAVAKIRSGKFDLTKDLPMDRDLEKEPASTREARDLDLGFADNGESRFRDLDVPSAMFD